MRVNLYVSIHKTLRRELSRLLADMGTADGADRPGAERLAVRLEDMAFLLEVHAEHEETFAHPALARVEPELARSLEVAHRTLDERMAEARAAARRAAAAGERERVRDLAASYRAFAGFVAAYFVHLEDEETRAMPALWAAYDDTQLRGIDGALQAAIPPGVKMRFLPLMLPAISGEERAGMLAGIRQHAPPEAFRAVCEVARRVLSDADSAALFARLGVDLAA
jgi:hypothetical protein